MERPQLESTIKGLIYAIRGERVMLDADLAALYGVSTSRLNEQVRRNLDRFPTDFAFVLTPEEADILRSQIAISKKGRGGARFAPPHAMAVHLIQLLTTEGKPVGPSGPMVKSGMGYLPWVMARAALGHLGDTLVIASLEDATIRRYVRGVDQSVGEIQLPKYFQGIVPHETIFRLPWIQFGEWPYVYDTPHLVNATFGSDGRLWAIRAYGYRFVEYPNPYLPGVGAWESTSQGLEVYERSGALAGAYDVGSDVHSTSMPAGVSSSCVRIGWTYFWIHLQARLSAGSAT